MFGLDTTSVSPAQFDSESASYLVPIIRVCAVRASGPVSSKGSVIPRPEREGKGVEKENTAKGWPVERASESGRKQLERDETERRLSNLILRVSTVEPNFWDKHAELKVETVAAARQAHSVRKGFLNRRGR